MVREKLEGSDILEMIPKTDLDQSRKRHEEVMKDVQDFLFSNISKISLIYQAEDEEEKVTFKDLERAISISSTDDLEKLIKKRYIPYEDGYILISITK